MKRLVFRKSLAVVGAILGGVVGSLGLLAVVSAGVAALTGHVVPLAGMPPSDSPGSDIVSLVRDALANRDGGQGIGHDIASSIRGHR